MDGSGFRQGNSPINILEGSRNAYIEHLNPIHIDGDYHVHVGPEEKSVYELLQPIEDASHTRDRKRAPPDSACARGTRVEVVKKYTTWTSDCISSADEPHVLWVHGYAGSGKSAISQEVCDTSKRERRPVVSFFFFRNAGERSKIRRLPNTLASQMATAIPMTEPFIRDAVKANPALLQPDRPGVSLRDRMEQLVYAPFKAAVEGGTATAKRSFRARVRRLLRAPSRKGVEGSTTIAALARGPFLIVLDGLDECDDKEEVQELIDGMFTFFDENPWIPLRVLITSRVEEHIQSRLNVPGVRLHNLVDHCSDDDIATFLNVLFEAERGRSLVIQAYIREHGEWPPPDDKHQLVRHIGGSFIFGSTVFKFIMGSINEAGSPATPMERLPLALKMNPGLDGLYAQTLARSQHLPHFFNIISTIALLRIPLPTSGIAELLGINTYEVVNVLVNLQAIIQVPGTDDIPVTLFHTSLRDFLTTQARSGPFFAHPRHHVFLFLRCLQCELLYRQRWAVLTTPSQRTSGAAYALQYSDQHLNRGEHLFEPEESQFAIRLCREALELNPGAPELIQSLACVTLRHATHGGTLADLDEAVSLNRAALTSRPHSHPDRPHSLRALGDALHERYKFQGRKSDLDEAILLHREELELRPPPHPDRSRSLHRVADGLWSCYQGTGASADIEEAISLLQEALQLRPSPHPDRSQSLHALAGVLLQRYQEAKAASDLEDVISLLQEAVELQPFPHPDRSSSLTGLAVALHDRYELTGSTIDLEQSISLHWEALELQPPPHPNRSTSLHNLALALKVRYVRTGTEADIEQAISLYREALELEPSPHSGRSMSLDNLANALWARYQRTGAVTDLEETISLHREALEFRQSPHPYRAHSLKDLAIALEDMYKVSHSLRYVQEAIPLCEELLAVHFPVGHKDRLATVNRLVFLLQKRASVTQSTEEDDAYLNDLKEEARQ
ncbi:hypothetical protein MD484_g2235, partial [Candolleomyces efflorescens]